MRHATEQEALRLATLVGGLAHPHWADGWQVTTRAGASAISTPYSYGGRSGLWEVQLTPGGEVYGWLTVTEATHMIKGEKPCTPQQ